MKNNAERNKEVTSKVETTIVNGSREEHVEKQIKTPLVRRSSKGRYGVVCHYKHKRTSVA